MRSSAGGSHFQDRSVLLPVPDWRVEYTVLMVVDRESAEVRRRRACRVLGRAWGAGGGGEMGHAGRPPRSGAMSPKERDQLACSILAPPAGFEPAHTAPECNPAYSRYQHERHLAFMRGGRMGRAGSSSSASPSARNEQLPDHVR